jgi:hypothetical protein
MKSLSLWARHYPSQARVVIIISWIMLTYLGIYIGITLKELSFILPLSVFLSSIAAFLITFLIYPLKHQRKYNKIISFYAWQKSCDIIVAAASFIMVIYVANKPETLFSGYQFAHAVKVTKTPLPADSIGKSYKSINDFVASLKDKNGNLLKWKERKKLLKTQLKEIRKADDMSKGGKTALIILSVLVAIGLLALVASAACSLSCNGSDAAAVLLGIGGTALVIWLLIFVIRRINGKAKKKRVKTETSEMSGQ